MKNNKVNLIHVKAREIWYNNKGIYALKLLSSQEYFN